MSQEVQIDNSTPSAPSPLPGPTPRRANRTLVWLVVLVIGFVVAPVVGCGAFGLMFGAASSASGAIVPSVGLIEISGPIYSADSGGLGGTVLGAESVIAMIDEAQADPNIRAILLRIDSPGGDVVASDEIHHALMQVDKPIVVSMGTLAASGGYYVAMPADFIYATPHTLTGSIGVISEFYNAEDLLDELGVEITVIAAGDMKDFGSFNREMTEEERAYWQNLVNETHEAFIRVVAEGRDLPLEDVRQLADGRVYTGQQALDLGLVDALGYEDDALAKAAELAGLTGEPNVIEMSPEPGLFDLLLGAQSRGQGIMAYELLRGVMVPSLRFVYAGAR